MINIENQNLSDGLTKLISDVELDFWGEFGLYVNFQKNDSLPTAGVTIRKNRMMFYYNNEFVHSLDKEEIIFLLLHEFFHLVRNHNDRAQSLTKHRVANVAMDMLINDAIVESYSHKCKMIEGGYTTPEEYKGERIFEPLYDWLNQKKDERDQSRQNMKSPSSDNSEEDDSDSESSDGEDNTEYDEDGKDANGNSKELNKVLDSLDEYEFDVHLGSDVPEEVKNQIVNDIVDGIRRKRGKLPDNVEQILEDFQKHKKNYLKQIQSACNYIKGGLKKSTFKRPSRRNIRGLKGRVRSGNVINVLLDVSGSMIGEFEKTIGILFRDGYKINMVQCDTEVKSHTQISDKNEIKNLKINGLGGTVLQPGLNYIKENLNKYNTCVITDGYCDDLDFTGIKKSILVTSAEVPKTIGNVKIIEIN